MKQTLIIGMMGLLLGLGLPCQAEQAPSLTSARASVVRLVIKIEKLSDLDARQKKALQSLMDDSGEDALFKGLLKSFTDGSPIAVATGVVVAKDDDTGYTHIATTYRIDAGLADMLYIQGPQGLERVDKTIGSDKERGLYFLKVKSLREKLEPITLHSNALGTYQSENALGEKIWLISFPKSAQLDNMTDREPSTQDGSIAALTKRNQDGTPVIQTGITAHISSSGGAIVNEKGELIALAGLDLQQTSNGMMEMLELAKKKRDSTVFGVPANFIRDYLVTFKIKMKAAPVSAAPQTQEATEAARKIAVVALQDKPTNAFGTGLIAAILAGVLAMIGLAIALLKSKKKSGEKKKLQLRYAGSDSMLRTQGPWTLNETGITVGREAQIRLNSEKASGLHARFVIRQGKAFVEHLSQTNSTLVNNQLISGSHPLNIGDRIQIAKGGDDIFIVDNAS